MLSGGARDCCRRETIKKLADLRAAAMEARIRLALPDALAHVTTVGQFVALSNLAEKDVALAKALQVRRGALLGSSTALFSGSRPAPDIRSRPRLSPVAAQAVLKLPKDKWDEVVAHAGQAVVPDFRPRVWYPPLADPLARHASLSGGATDDNTATAPPAGGELALPSQGASPRSPLACAGLIFPCKYGAVQLKDSIGEWGGGGWAVALLV